MTDRPEIYPPPAILITWLAMVPPLLYFAVVMSSAGDMDGVVARWVAFTKPFTTFSYAIMPFFGDLPKRLELAGRKDLADLFVHSKVFSVYLSLIVVAIYVARWRFMVDCHREMMNYEQRSSSKKIETIVAVTGLFVLIGWFFYAFVLADKYTVSVQRSLAMQTIMVPFTTWLGINWIVVMAAHAKIAFDDYRRGTQLPEQSRKDEWLG